LAVDQDDILRALQEEYQALQGTSRELRLEDRLEDLRIDSLAAQELLVALEDRCSVEILTDALVTRVVTVGDIVELILSASRRLRTEGAPDPAPQ